MDTYSHSGSLPSWARISLIVLPVWRLSIFAKSGICFSNNLASLDRTSDLCRGGERDHIPVLNALFASLTASEACSTDTEVTLAKYQHSCVLNWVRRLTLKVTAHSQDYAREFCNYVVV